MKDLCELQIKLENIWDELDAIQETDIIQDPENRDLMFEISEAMCYIDNLIEIINERLE